MSSKKLYNYGVIFDVIDRTIRSLLKQGLSKYPDKKIRILKLSSCHKAKRKSNCILMRRPLKGEKVEKMMFSGKKTLTIYGYLNPQNDIVLPNDRQNANGEVSVL